VPKTRDSRGLLQWSIKNVSLASAEHELETIARKPVISSTDFEAATGVVNHVLQVNTLLGAYLPCYYMGSRDNSLTYSDWLEYQVLILGEGRSSFFRTMCKTALNSINLILNGYRGTMLQAGKSWVRFPIRSFYYSIDLILSAAL
jgi:hypothetical protein